MLLWLWLAEEKPAEDTIDVKSYFAEIELKDSENKLGISSETKYQCKKGGKSIKNKKNSNKKSEKVGKKKNKNKNTIRLRKHRSTQFRK